MKTAAHQDRSHYPALDGLRGIAILLVVFYHNFGFINYFFFGWLGVDLFFVLSGFLITDILLKTKSSPNYIRNFYARRALRILPLYYLTLFIFFIIIPIAFPGILLLDYYIQNQVWFWTYLQNWLFIFHPPHQNTSGLVHLWSLAVEEQYYIFWPFIILIFQNLKALIPLLITILFGVITLRFIVWTYQIQNLTYFNLYTFSRIDGICIGSLLAVLRVVNQKAINKYFTLIILGLSALNFLFYFFNAQNQFSYPYFAIVGYSTFAVLFALLVNEGVERADTVINKLLSFSLFQFFGTISYGLYIFHGPAYFMLSPILKEWSSQNMKFLDPWMFASITSSSFAVLLAWISFRFFEKRFLLLKKRFY